MVALSRSERALQPDTKGEGGAEQTGEGAEGRKGARAGARATNNARRHALGAWQAGGYTSAHARAKATRVARGVNGCAQHNTAVTASYRGRHSRSHRRGVWAGGPGKGRAGKKTTGGGDWWGGGWLGGWVEGRGGWRGGGGHRGCRADAEPRSSRRRALVLLQRPARRAKACSCR